MSPIIPEQSGSTWKVMLLAGVALILGACVLLSSDTSASTVTADGRRPASHPRGFIGKYPKGRKHLR